MRKAILGILLSAALLTGCTANQVSNKIIWQADEFNISRKVSVINTRNDKTVYENQGLISVTITESGNRLDVITKTDTDTYTKDIVILNQDTMLIVEDLEGIHVK